MPPRTVVPGSPDLSVLLPCNYGQVAYHFLPGALPQFPNSIFTLVGRYDHVDLGGSDETCYTVGINFRPEEETALKLDYEIYDQADGNNGLIFSVASYF